MIELGPRLTYCTSPHPSWRPGAAWPRDVGWLLYRHAGAIVLIDPLIADDGWPWLEAAVAQTGSPVAILVTAPWHRRSAAEVSARFGAKVWATERALERLPATARLERLPPQIATFAPRGVDEGQVAFFLERERTLFVGELFLGTSEGLEVTPSPATTDLNAFLESLRELESLPIDRVLVSHGPPVLEGGGDAVTHALRRSDATP